MALAVKEDSGLACESVSTNERLFSARCCTYNSCFVPASLVECIGVTKNGRVCCSATNGASCLFPSHSRYNEMLVGTSDDVWCIFMSGESVITKPVFLRGEPLAKGTTTGWCCTDRLACPGDADVPCVCAHWFLK